VCEICHDGIQASFHVARGFPFDLNVDRRERLSIEHSRASRVSGLGGYSICAKALDHNNTKCIATDRVLNSFWD
jgi:hypothetical protein